MRKIYNNEVNVVALESWLHEAGKDHPFLQEAEKQLQNFKLTAEGEENDDLVTTEPNFAKLEVEKLYLFIFRLLCENDQILVEIGRSKDSAPKQILGYVLRWRQLEVISDKFNTKRRRDAIVEVISAEDFLMSPLLEIFAEDFAFESHITSNQGNNALKRIMRDFLTTRILAVQDKIKSFTNGNSLCEELKSLSDIEIRILGVSLMDMDYSRQFNVKQFNRHTKSSHDHEDFLLALQSYAKSSEVDKALKMDESLVRGYFLTPTFHRDEVNFKPGPKINEMIFGAPIDETNIIETQFSEVIENDGVTFEKMVLPPHVKSYILSLVSAFKRQKSSPLQIMNSLLFCFQGAPGTGKTMLAKAIANELGYKVVRVKVLTSNPRYFKFLMQVHAGKDVILLFDECDQFLSRNVFTGANDAWAKILFEEYKGIMVFTTNYLLSQALLRRMTFVYNFENQTVEDKVAILNLEIEKLSKDLPIETVLPRFQYDDFGDDSEALDLTGGYFKQAIQMSLSKSIAENGEARISKEQVITAIDFLNDQVFFEPEDRKSKAKVTLQDVILNEVAQEQVHKFLAFIQRSDKKLDPLAPPAAMLLAGPSGTGKTILAEGIAHHLGKEFISTSGASFLGPYVGQTEAQIKKVFKKASEKEQVLFIDEVESLFRSRDKAQASWQISQVNEFLIQIEKFKGVLIVATNLIDELDFAFSRRFLFHVKMELPTEAKRLELWQKYAHGLSISEEELAQLSEQFVLSGGDIRNICYRAKAHGIKDLIGLIKECNIESLNKVSQSKRIGIR